MLIYDLIIYAPTPVKPSYLSLFCPNNCWIISQIVLIWSYYQN